MDGSRFLQEAAKLGRKPIYALIGEEAFLQMQALRRIREVVLGPDDSDLAVTSLDGATARPADILDELAMRPLLSPHRLVVVDPSDPFLAVDSYRTALEDYLEHPSAPGTLVLVSGKWNKNWRLHKRAERVGCVVECKAVPPREMVGWVMARAQQVYQKKLSSAAARLFADVVSQELGLADSELAKLAAYVGQRTEITPADVEAVAVGGRLRTSWEVMDAVADGQPLQAVHILDRLLAAGESPVMIVAALAWQVRRLLRATAWLDRGEGAARVCERAGVPPSAREDFLRRLRRLGAARLQAGFRALLEADLAIKGDTDLPPRAVLERWILRMSA